VEFGGRDPANLLGGTIDAFPHDRVENTGKEVAMNTKRTVTGSLVVAGLCAAWPALAATAEGNGGIGFWVILFLAFGALIIAFQFIPAVVMFASMMKGLFRRAETEAGAGKRAEKRA
jgi:hypothetical protein